MRPYFHVFMQRLAYSKHPDPLGAPGRESSNVEKETIFFEHQRLGAMGSSEQAEKIAYS